MADRQAVRDQFDVGIKTLEVTMAEQYALRDHALKQHQGWVRGLHQIMVLAARVLAVLWSRYWLVGRDPAALLRDGAFRLFVSVGIGALAQFVCNYLVDWLIVAMDADHRRRVFSDSG